MLNRLLAFATVAPFSILVAFGASQEASSQEVRLFAQSTVTLDDFDLGDVDGSKLTESSRDIESCLLESSECANSKFKSSKSFSIDDVVNLGIVDREEVDQKKDSSGTQSLASVDIEVLFEYDSDQLRPDQAERLFDLAKVIKDNRFLGSKFAIIGHADAKGDPLYNVDLSQRRAQAVLEFVAASSGLPTKRFASLGRGSQDLKTPDDPLGPANRRVQIVLIPVK